ncbi:MAG: hypothetical protein PHW04_06605 [Candidatus Wallbacteria bacterium]|nr:hypothetical protein [Candidatus Wallbacteria bacterium]
MTDQGKKIGFADCGVYNGVIAGQLQELGWEVAWPPKITSKTITLGSAHSPEMICFPFKVTLGTIIEQIQSGVKNILVYNSQGHCRFSHFHNLYSHTLKELGLECNLLLIDRRKPLSSIRNAAKNNPGNLKIAAILFKAWRRLLRAERKLEMKYSQGRKKVILVGEAYSTIVPELNHHLRERLLNCGIATSAPALFSHYFLKKHHLQPRTAEDAEAHELLNAPIAGCAFESVRNTIAAAGQGFHGIIHLYPLTCMPETTVSPLVDSIARARKLPLLKFEIDENLSPLNVETRIETFAEIINNRRS